jgi:NSS family neurotransmitter:Na+ symporter
MEKDTTQYTSGLTTVLTMLGVAVGLGNVWRFPYMMGSYGGSAFLVIYLLLTLLFAFPALMAEMALGRMSGKGTLNAFRLGFGNRWGGILGYLLLGVITIAGAYYAVVVANVVYTTFFSVITGFTKENNDHYLQGLSNGWLQFAITLLLIGSSLLVIHKGLLKGIEFLSKIIMPFFLVAIAYMIFHTLSLPNALVKCKEFLSPDFSVLGLREIFAALGQAFFSVGLGGTFVVVYSGFMRKEESIVKMALYTGFGDAGASLLISLFLIPSILVFGMDMASGPRLIFNTFPALFSTMPGGRLVGSLFLLCVTLVAFLSLIAAYQVPFTSIKNEQANPNGKRILIYIGLLQATLALPCCFFPEIIGTLDLIFGSGMQVLGSAFAIVGLTWGLQRQKVFQELFGSEKDSAIRPLVFYWIKWIIPLALLAVLIGYIYDVLS